MANGDNSPFESRVSGGNDLSGSDTQAVPSGSTVDKMKHNNHVSPPQTNSNLSLTPFEAKTSQPSPINDNGGSPIAKNDDTLSQAHVLSIASEPQKTKGDDKQIKSSVPSQSDRQSASHGTVPDNLTSTGALASKNFSLEAQITGNDPLTASQKSSKTKRGIFSWSKGDSSVKAKRVDHPSESDAKAVPPHTIVDGEPSAIPFEPSDTSQFSSNNNDGIPPSVVIDNALSQAPASSTGSRPYKTKGDDKPDNHVQESVSQGGTLPDTPSSTDALGASKGFSLKSFIPNANRTKLNGGIDPSESNADTDPPQTSGNNPPKTKNTSRLSKFTAEIFKSKRDGDLSKDDVNAVLPCTTVDEDRMKPNTDANEDSSTTPFAPSTSQPPKVGDSHAKVDDYHPQTPRDANPSQAADDLNCIEDLPKPDDKRSQRNPHTDSAPTIGDKATTDGIDEPGDSNGVMDDEHSESSETDTDDEKDGNQVPARAPPNIIVFGETGVGKSSLIKMLGGSSEKQPEVSGDAAGCTTGTAYYSITIGKKQVEYRVWDTPGLNEGGKGTVPTSVALKKIHDRVQKLERVNLLVYCIRGAEYRDIIQVNYDLVAKLVCGGKVPVVAVVSWLENEENMKSWWKDNHEHFKKMKFKNHACVTTTKGKMDGDKFVFQKEYDKSRKRVQKVIKKESLSKGIKPDAIADVEDALKNYMEEHNAGTEQERKSAGRLLRFFSK